MRKQLLIKELSKKEMQCPKCLSWVRCTETLCSYCRYPLHGKNRYKKSLLEFLRKNLSK